MEYADYYYGELNKVSDVSTLDLSKGDIVDATFKNGEYDAVTSATTKKSKGLKQHIIQRMYRMMKLGKKQQVLNINGIANVQIRIPVELYKNITMHIRKIKIRDYLYINILKMRNSLIQHLMNIKN